MRDVGAQTVTKSALEFAVGRIRIWEDFVN